MPELQPEIIPEKITPPLVEKRKPEEVKENFKDLIDKIHQSYENLGCYNPMVFEKIEELTKQIPKLEIAPINHLSEVLGNLWHSAILSAHRLEKISPEDKKRDKFKDLVLSKCNDMDNYLSLLLEKEDYLEKEAGSTKGYFPEWFKYQPSEYIEKSKSYFEEQERILH